MTTQDEKQRRAQLRKEAGLSRFSELRRVYLAKEHVLPFQRRNYFVAHACFGCRKSFKRIPQNEKAVFCPQCGTPSAEMGRSFKAPRKSESKQWKKVERLWKAGYRFPTNTGWHDVVPYPDKLSDVEQFIADNPCHPFRLNSHRPKV